MAEYIEREAAREKCCSMCEWEGTGNCDECEHPIDDIPAADVRPVIHATWETDTCHFYCSECEHYVDYKTNYCPHCGALMDKGGDGDV